MKEKSPGFQACIKMMRKGNAGQIQEDGFHWLLPHVDEYIDKLIDEFRKPENARIQSWLLELIGFSHTDKAFVVLSEQLRSDNRDLRQWAVSGLAKFGTKEAQRILKEARSYELSSPEATQELREMLGPEQSWKNTPNLNPLLTGKSIR